MTSPLAFVDGVEVAAGREGRADIDAAQLAAVARPLEEALGQRPALALGAGREVIVHLVEQHAAAGVENGGADEDDDEGEDAGERKREAPAGAAEHRQSPSA